MKYSLVKVETLAPGARFVRLEIKGYGTPPAVVTYTILKREYDDTHYEWGMLATIEGDRICYRYHFADGTLVFAEDP